MRSFHGSLLDNRKEDDSSMLILTHLVKEELEKMKIRVYFGNYNQTN